MLASFYQCQLALLVVFKQCLGSSFLESLSVSSSVTLSLSIQFWQWLRPREGWKRDKEEGQKQHKYITQAPLPARHSKEQHIINYHSTPPFPSSPLFPHHLPLSSAFWTVLIPPHAQVPASTLAREPLLALACVAALRLSMIMPRTVGSNNLTPSK